MLKAFKNLFLNLNGCQGGAQLNGTECEEDNQCAEGSICASRKCAWEVGVNCDDVDVPNEDGSAKKLCLAKKTYGCGDGDEPATNHCIDGLICDPKTIKCVDPKEDGEGCSKSSQCKSAYCDTCKVEGKDGLRGQCRPWSERAPEDKPVKCLDGTTGQ